MHTILPILDVFSLLPDKNLPIKTCKNLIHSFLLKMTQIYIDSFIYVLTVLFLFLFFVIVFIFLNINQKIYLFLF